MWWTLNLYEQSLISEGIRFAVDYAVWQLAKLPDMILKSRFKDEDDINSEG